MADLVSIIVPCYNQARYLPEALDSVLAQTYTNWECIIVNDGSPDNSEQVALQYCSADARFKYHKKENGGLSSARNAGLALAKGTWLQFLDSDDYVCPEKLERSLNLVAEHPGVNLVVSSFKMFALDHTQATDAFCELNQDCLTLESIIFKWGGLFSIPIHCGLFKADIFKEIRFNESFKAIEDWVMWIDVFSGSVQAKYMDIPLAYYRNNPQSMTKDRSFLMLNLVKAYKHVLHLIPDQDAKQFSNIVIDRLHNRISQLEEQVSHVKSSPFYKVEQSMRAVLRKIRGRGDKNGLL